MVLADRGFLVRGARRVLVMVGQEPLADLELVLAGLKRHTLAEILVLGPEGSMAERLESDGVLGGLGIDILRFMAESAYQAEVCQALGAFAPDLVVNADPVRHPAWDLVAAGTGAVLGIAFQAPPRAVEASLAAFLDRPYTVLMPSGAGRAILEALGMEAGAPSGGSLQ
jgi:hypothetical protein